MNIGIPSETHPEETRVALIPPLANKLVSLGATVQIEPNLGYPFFADQDYRQEGIQIGTSRNAVLSESDLIMRIRKPEISEVTTLKPNAIHISLMDPFNDPELVKAFCSANITAISLELIPRTTLAQKMDVLSSQASLGGYVAVLQAAERLPKIFPMMMTPAGTITPTRVFVIGAGVAGLQAVATAKRLGAKVVAFDTRPEVKEQVESLGGSFLEIDLGPTQSTDDGYAGELTPEQLATQQMAMAKQCAQSDIVITTAQVFGRKAPQIMTDQMVQNMKPGSVIVDMAVESGGNVEGSEYNQIVERHHICIIGIANLPGRVPIHASQLFASNLVSFISHFWEPAGSQLNLDLDDPILQGCVVTHQGKIVQERLIR